MRDKADLRIRSLVVSSFLQASASWMGFQFSTSRIGACGYGEGGGIVHPGRSSTATSNTIRLCSTRAHPTVPTDGGLTPTFGEFFRRATSTSSEPTN